MICNLPGHYEQGMRVDFTVTGTSNEPPSTPESTPASEPPNSGVVSIRYFMIPRQMLLFPFQ